MDLHRHLRTLALLIFVFSANFSEAKVSQGCKTVSQNTSLFGCCPDGHTPAHGHNEEGCCINTPFGCCPDNILMAGGPALQGCECGNSKYGCCPNGVDYAKGPTKAGCGCKYTEFGCCQDGFTEATGPDYAGCSCETFQFGCCPDGETTAKGAANLGCGCKESEFGCCPDKATPAKGPDFEGCGCDASEFGCCPDGVEAAQGEKFEDCADVTKFSGEACALPRDRGMCLNFTSQWFFDIEYGGCSKFWYGGCEGNNNRFDSEEECKNSCEAPPGQDACFLPKISGPCKGYKPMWHYDTERKACTQFVYGGCYGNKNKFKTLEECQLLCAHQELRDKCAQPQLEGPCNGKFERWFFSSEESVCKRFIFGGCKGNQNNFLSENTCKQQCQSAETIKGLQASEPEYQSFRLCPDGLTPAHGQNKEGCCINTPFGCCPDNILAAGGPALQGCECANSKFGCCPNGFDYAKGPRKEGCGCKYTEFGCCQDGFTDARGPDYAGCSCETFQFGCCPDGETTAKGAANLGCGCKESEFGCCPDKATPAKGPDFEGCGCDASEFGCCPDGVEAAQGEKFEECADAPKFSGEACALPRDRGTCRNFTIRWFFDTEYGACSRLWYGGCEGNNNRFNSEDECKNSCVAPPGRDACFLPKISGICEGYKPTWHYDTERKACTQFVYGGCLGNNNKFETREECQQLCAHHELRDKCAQPQLEGPCNGNFERWYFSSEESVCRRFRFGGCKGNQNNFLSENACKQQCQSAETVKAINKCTLPSAKGPCRASILRWYFNTKAGECQVFSFGGCRGNKNNFQSRKECEKSCDPDGLAREENICRLAPAAGECSQFVTSRWFYNVERQQCMQFSYGGCGGNSNNFERGEDCSRQCKQQAEPEEPHKAADNEKPGMCPPAKEGAECEHTCREDGDCPGSNKCCFNSCAYRCRDPNVMVTKPEEPATTPPATTPPATTPPDPEPSPTLGQQIHPNCTDNPLFANCKLIVRGKYCTHKYYPRFCCRSCTEAGQLPLNGPHLQGFVPASSANN